MKKKKLTAWLLAVAMTLGSVNPVFASEAELFTDGGTETVQMQEEEVPEDETEENEELIKSFGCEYGQGFYYSRPVSVQEFSEKYLNHKYA